jgi:SAM-dependent methyltransferase
MLAVRPMGDDDAYYDYLTHRSRLGAIYRRWWLYPRLSSRLVGHALDVGCGLGDMVAFRPGTVGVDVNPRTVAHCVQRGLPVVQMDSDRLPFTDCQFDSALMDNVLEHIARPEQLLHELHRVLRPGGCLIVGVPGHRGWDSDTDHKVFYDEASLPACVEPVGFRHAEVFHAPLWRSAWLDRHLRQYCLYSLFTRG